MNLDIHPNPLIPNWRTINDTKWRKPSLEKLRNYIGEHKYIELKDGLKTLKKCKKLIL